MNCEICGQPANNAVRDLKEVPPLGTTKQWEDDGEPHWFCNRHVRESIHRALPPDWRLKTARS
jgi:hypothetical protein